MGNQKIKTKVMNKLEPNFIKSKVIEYANKVTQHHYQHNGNKEQKGNRIILIPVVIDDLAIIIEAEINKEDKVIHLSSQQGNNKRWLKSQLFHIWRTPYQERTSVKKYKRYVEIENKLKDLISEHHDSIKENYQSYSGLRNVLKDILSKFN